MTLVVDASVAVRWFFQLTGTDRARLLLRAGETLVAPDFVVAEITNAAWKAAMFEGRPVDAAAAAVHESSRFFSRLVPSIVLKDRAFAIALELRHAAYDCFYLALANMEGSALVTADERLLRRCAGTRFETAVRRL